MTPRPAPTLAAVMLRGGPQRRVRCLGQILGDLVTVVALRDVPAEAVALTAVSFLFNWKSWLCCGMAAEKRWRSTL